MLSIEKAFSPAMNLTMRGFFLVHMFGRMGKKFATILH